MPDDKRLKTPSHVSQQDLSPEAAYVAAVTSLPRLIHEGNQILRGVVEELNGIHDKLDVLSLYAERKGLDEKLFSPEDLEPEQEEPEDEPATE